MDNSDNGSEFLKPETYRDTVSTVTIDGKRKWIYALKPSGKFYNWRSILAAIYLLAFFIMPFIKIDGQPFLMINIIESKFVIFSKPFWPQDFYIFAFGMITFLIFIILFTVIYGRVFCGWICPQTIFMEFVFRKIEWWIDGNPMQQQKLHQMEWNAEKIRKRVLKIVIFFLVSFLIAHTFLSYILGVDEVLKILSEPLSDHILLFLGLLFFTFLFFSVYYFVREIVCTTICPYGRLQGVMFDNNTMQVAYDYVRGETRERYSKNRERQGGDCVDCHKCVDVCPTGIDIRNGLQMECVGCTACIDACNEIMDKFGFERNLIRFASKENIEKKEGFKFTTRVKAYTILLTILAGILLTLIFTRSSVSSYLNRVGGQLYQEVDTDTLSNYYLIKIINKNNYDLPFQFKVNKIAGRVKVVGNKELVLKKEAVTEYYFWVYTHKNQIKKRNTKIEVVLEDKNQKELDKSKTNFYGPY
ncbi:MAG: cytochrome c oxidase accessory protein CcoG [Chitinophagales bacterium]|nr:cytochrome c oxidase accessory protein CcoG [Chitinophagales bacterium]